MQVDDQSISEEHIGNTKNVRRRKKNLYQSILKQMEFYFSDANIKKDRFIGQLIQSNPYVDLSVFLKFNKISALTNKVEEIATALEKSEILNLSEDRLKVCRTTPIKEKDNEDECTIYVERLPEDTTHDWLKEIFCTFGGVDYISLPKYKHNKRHKGFAFIEFADPEVAQKAVSYFESIGCKLPTQMPPNQLASIITFEPDNLKNRPEKKEEEPTEQPHKNNENSENSDQNTTSVDIVDTNIKKKKRKHSIENEEIENKKLKTEDIVTNDEVDEENKKEDVDKKPIESTERDEESIQEDATDISKRKRKRKKSKKNHCDFTQMGLQVLTKREWKQLRNKYLNMQRIKMKTLKEHLYRNRHHRTDYDSNCVTMKEESQVCTSEPKFKFTEGCIVQFLVPETCTDVKKLKSDIRTHAGVEFIDVQPGKEIGFIRFSESASSAAFINSSFLQTAEVLKGQDESDYWDKIMKDRESKLNKAPMKKIRGREKLLKKAEHELGKHIRFESI